jgi:hypothetical protein
MASWKLDSLFSFAMTENDMWHFIKTYALILPVFLLIDLRWLGKVVVNFYKAELGALAHFEGDSLAPVWWAAAVVYLLIPLGIEWRLANAHAFQICRLSGGVACIGAGSRPRFSMAGAGSSLGSAGMAFNSEFPMVARSRRGRGQRLLRFSV